MSLIEAWEQAKNLIREKIGAAAFQGWLNKVSAKEVSPDTISLGVPDIFIKDWVTEHYMALIEDSLQKITGSKKGVELRIEPCFDMPQEKLEPFAPGAAVA